MALKDIDDDPILGQSVAESIRNWKAPLEEDAGLAATKEQQRRKKAYKIGFIALCLAVTLIVSAIAITYGAANIGFLECYEIIYNHLFGTVSDDLKDRIIFDLRMPRVVAAIFIGSALAVCGVVLQSVLRNPLADPYTTGVSSGASLGAVLAMIAGIELVSYEWNLIAMAFMFSLIPLGVMVAISRFKNSSPTTMIMAGIGIMYIFNAVTTLLMLLSDPQDLAGVYRWQVGTLDLITKNDLTPIIIVTIVGLILMQLITRKLNVLSTGDENAKGMGLDVEKTRITCLILVGIVTATAVSFTGMIGFVGLVVPHIVRIFIGADNRFLLPASAALGSTVLVIADLIGRWALAPTILQVGVIMSFFGGPLFLWLIIRRNNSLWR